MGQIDTSAATPVEPGHAERPTPQVAGIMVRDTANRRLLQTIAASLDLQSVVLELAEFDPDRLADFELIIADEEKALRLRPLITAQLIEKEQIRPALVAVVPAPIAAVPPDEEADSFDAVLALPDNPSVLSAQLGVALYAHRAFARRYRSALEELNLNRNIFRSVTSGISIANAQLPDMPLMYVNPAFEAMTGYSLEEVEGKNCRFLQNGETDQPGLTLIREALSKQRETVAVLKNYRKDGRLFWNELALSPIRNRDGELTHIVGIQMDVTERVELETALRESEKLAAVGRLASAISHEINNPLEAVMNLVYLMDQVLPESEQNTEVRSYIRQADEELKRMKLITAQALRFSKQSHGPEAVTCEDLLSPIIEIYGPRFKNYNVTVELRNRTDQHIVCMVSEIRQVLTNLITNSVHAMHAGGGRLLVRTREAMDTRNERRGIAITIADTGVGMDSATMTNIYKAFFTTKGLQGTGLGLWISAEIVARHHGHLDVRSSRASQRHGTVFRLFLPYQGAAGEDPAKA
ncbi:PAS domain S-box [Terriglobus roseus DSM 18391]|uniref:histidine kinase n=1 Tax=Terriglobus roseus (strain DSM 18391 / NRRL B-41598 / KBS 63) TaxID=926566 RepID=I3ZDW9_TERRK|nr:PAS domain S-box protein [Terriglobus roseus]AFL87437.1 PAS domain S-box [Terriglobus roseus DSM 18391]